MKVDNYSKSFLFASLFIGVALLLQSCGIGGKVFKEADSSRSISKDEVIIVGTIELSPKLIADEQKFDVPGMIDLFGYADMNRNRGMLQFNLKPEKDSYKLMANPKLGEVFTFVIPKNIKYIVDGYILAEVSKFGEGKILLPTGFKIDIKANDKAVYIGKIKYIRDDFNSITSVKLEDDYRNANKGFRKKFGNKYKLRKSLVKNSH